MDFLIFENDFYKVEHCYSCSIPGYLIVSPKVRVNSLVELSMSYQIDLGPALATASYAVQKVIEPLRVYCAQFGEESVELHFHVFPRTDEITRAFLLDFPDQKTLIHGPILLDWARTKYKNEPRIVWATVSQVIEKMRQIVRQRSGVQNI